MMNFISTRIPEVLRIILKVYTDQRGFFLESYNKKLFINAGITHEFVQDNLSSSVQYTLRGLHYQITHPQGKLVRVIRGEVFDVAVDLRKESRFFGNWVGVMLSEKNQEAIWIPPGFAHGFFTLSSRADVIYKTTDYYDPIGERCILWEDPDLDIDWPIPDGVRPLLSEKDSQGLLLNDSEVYP